VTALRPGACLPSLVGAGKNGTNACTEKNVMDTTMKTNDPIYHESLFRRWWKSRSFIQQRMIRMCMSMLVMILCFPLYYLGLFGTVDGPLHPARLGDTLAGMGMTQTHSTTLFLGLLILALTWNLIYNMVCLAVGARLTCKRTMDDGGTVCGAAVRRSRSVDRKTGQRAAQYECTHGHKRADAHFHPKKKGTASHVVWVICLAFFVIVVFF
jgi:hypothetical protein